MQDPKVRKGRMVRVGCFDIQKQELKERYVARVEAVRDDYYLFTDKTWVRRRPLSAWEDRVLEVIQ